MRKQAYKEYMVKDTVYSPAENEWSIPPGVQTFAMNEDADVLLGQPGHNKIPAGQIPGG